MRKVKAAVIGAGFIGQAHIEAVRRTGLAEVTAIVQSSQDKAEALARKLHIPKAYGDFQDVLRDPDIEVVHNCTPNHLHYEINKQILQHGKHLLSEKPLTMTSEEARELYQLSREKELVTGINFNYRQFPMVQQFRQMVQNKELGVPRLVRGHYLQDWLMYETDYNWRMEPAYGGQTRAIGDIGSHLYDLSQYVTGKRITEVFADLATIIPQRYKPVREVQSFQTSSTSEMQAVDVETEDYCTVLAKFEDGSRGVLTVSQISAGKKNGLELALDGSLASASWNQEEPFRLKVGYRDQPSSIIVRDPALVDQEVQSYVHYPGGHEEGWPDSLKNMMNHFYAAVLGDQQNRHAVASFQEGYQLMLLIDAIVESGKSGKWVKVKQES
ncbi:gfo/Idh/MocA family oxidoreductase [Xylanibacillus composti]|uniref:Dehydrogenase n=1 Tax=Xylanibacillus composti TaxID=1572762 RepID=A0A8J4H9J1_9BACL|nr:Gfo/Idh/MocA family oxidoreductase [Xylanibacillus composti]MDT9723699.1 gfo/Idh/MocA family oxidoreductase [Xylanibacillus composti]GIQ71418.1 dehydrogenase [Xylanibacillus composti]